MMTRRITGDHDDYDDQVTIMKIMRMRLKMMSLLGIQMTLKMVSLAKTQTLKIYHYCHIDAYCIIREEDEGAESRSGVVFVPHVEDGRAELRSSTKLIQI